MRHQSQPTSGVEVSWIHAICLLLGVIVLGCAEDDRLPNYRPDLSTVRPKEAAVCATPSEGCSCDQPGELVDCGEVRVRVDEYVTCTEGVRRCGADRTWGACVGDLVTRNVPASSGKVTEALGSVESCTAQNPCDPLCRQIVDSGVGLDGLPDGLCSTALGLGPCPLCGYAGPAAGLANTSMPTEWQIIPTSCTPQSSNCPHDMDCVNSECRERTSPCATKDQVCAVDLTLGKPCFDAADPAASYHIPLCNRGAADLLAGTIRIAVDSRSASATECAPSSLGGFPDSGTIEFTLANGATIASGTCVDVTPANSVPTGLDFSGNRAFVVNYDRASDECNSCNNGSVMITDSAVGELSSCPSCTNLQCHQTDPTTTLRGVIYDPAGIRPVPNVIVYVPNEAVTPFVDGVACDTCESLVSGSPITWTTTDATGHFALTKVPSDTNFPIVVQIGRWRREYTVQSIPAGRSAWAIRYSGLFGYVVVTLDPNEPEPYSRPTRRLHLPATQKRCLGSYCTGEGDIPKMAVLMGDADPVQCALRRIGIADSEISCYWDDVRVQVFSSDGMAHWNGLPAYGAGGLITDPAQPGLPTLRDYSLLLAPCNRTRGDDDYAQTPLSSGPSYNGWPSFKTTAQERAKVREFVDAGGRLITTHWESLDLVYGNFGNAPRASLASGAANVPLSSPFSPDADFDAAVTTYANGQAPGFGWVSPIAAQYNANAPALYLFGNNVTLASNAPHDLQTAVTPRYPALAYDFEIGNTDGATFAAWANAVGATTAAGSNRLWWNEWSPMVSQVRPELGATALLTSDSRDAARYEAQNGTPPGQQACLAGNGTGYDCGGRVWGDSHVGMFLFDTPMDSDNKCGRVAVISGHTSQHSCFAPSGSRESKYCSNQPPYSESNPAPDCDCVEFPASADIGCGSASSPMSAEELAFEYLLFRTSQCSGALKTAIPSAGLVRREFRRDFEANCAPRSHPRWQLFSWQASVPTNTKITFYGSTADTEEGLADARFVVIGVADRSTTTWTANNRTVDNAFREMPAPPDVSHRWLRVVAAFEPNGSSVPVLREWRAVFNCVENE